MITAASRLVLIAMALVRFASADDITGDAYLLPHRGSHPWAQVEVGAVEIGGTATVRVRVHNTTPRDIVFDAVPESCNCGEVTPQSGKIAAGDSHQFSVQMQFEAHPIRPKGRFDFYFDDHSKRIGQVTVHYQHQGFVGFEPRKFSREFSEASIPTAVDIPLAYQGAFASDGIESRFLGGGTKSVTSVSVLSDPPRVRVAIDRDMLKNYAVRDQLAIFDGKGERRDAIPFIFAVAEPVTVLPGIATLNIDENRNGSIRLICLFKTDSGDRTPKFTFTLGSHTGEGKIDSQFGRRMIVLCVVPEDVVDMVAETEKPKLRFVVQSKDSRTVREIPILVE